MSDYKELIELLRDENNCDVLDYIDEAATAIETLLAERDALLEALHGECDECVYKDLRVDEEPCSKCAFSDYYPDWQWRGIGGSDET